MKRRRRRKQPEPTTGPPKVPKNCPPELHRQIGGRTLSTRPTPAPPEPLQELTRTEFRALLLSLGFHSYEAYLWSPAWLEARRAVLKRAHGRCEDCGAKASQVHHLVYTEANLRLDSFEGLLALCRTCHERRHLYDFSYT